MKHFTCQEGEVCRAGDGEVGRCDIQGFHSVHGHFVEVRRVHIAVVIPPESVEGDQQHLLSRFVCRRREDGRGQEEAEAGGPQHGAHRHCVRCQLTRSWSRSNLLASHLPRQSSRAKFPPQLILSRSSDRRYLSALSHAALMMFMSWFFTAGSCVHSEFPPVFCSWVPAVKQINLPEHRGCLSPPPTRLLMLSFCLSAAARLCVGVSCESPTMGEWHFDGFHLELGWCMIDLTPGKWRGKWEYISLRQLAVVSRGEKRP